MSSLSIYVKAYKTSEISTESEYEITGLISKINPEKNNIALEEFAVALGQAFLIFPNHKSLFLSKLKTLSCIGDSAHIANIEIGSIFLHESFYAKTKKETSKNLKEAALYFEKAHQKNPDNDISKIFQKTIELCLMFLENNNRDEIYTLASSVQEDIGYLINYYQNEDPEQESTKFIQIKHFYRLTQDLLYIKTNTDQDNWLNAAEVLEGIFNIYITSKQSIAIKNEPMIDISKLVKPILYDSFAQKNLLKTHLKSWIETLDTNSKLYEEASALWEDIKDKDKPQGNESRADDISQSFAHLTEDNIKERLEQLLSETTRDSRFLSHDKTTSNIFNEISSKLKGCPDYHDSTKIRFDTLLDLVIVFLKDRHNIGSSTIGKRTEYLFKDDALEHDLGQDIRDFLIGSPLSKYIKSEVSDISSGRVDVYIDFDDEKYSIELKRSFNSVDRSKALAWLPQASSYSNCDTCLGMLGILDISKKKEGSKHLKECIWLETYTPPQSTTKRYIVVFVVLGNKTPPSSLVYKDSAGP